MAGWTTEELEALGAEREVEVTTPREDGDMRDPVTIWVVRVDDELYVRSYKGPEGAWYKGAEQAHEGRIEGGGISREIGFVDSGAEHEDEIDAAYVDKYDGSSAPTKAMLTPEVKATTLRLEAR